MAAQPACPPSCSKNRLCICESRGSNGIVKVVEFYFMSQRKVSVFPDTNIFLHYRPLNELPWLAMLGVSDAEIKIAPVVTRELEEKKVFHSVPRIRQRAESALKRLHALLKQSPPRIVIDNLTLEFLAKEPSNDFAATHGLNLHIADDRLIGTMLSFRDQNPDFRCVLATGDLGLCVKASHFQIEFIEPSEEFRLPSEPDANEKEITQLKTKLRAYELASPILDVTFDNGEKYQKFILPAPVPFPEKEIALRINELKEKYPMTQSKPAASSPSTPLLDYTPLFTEEMRKSVEALAESLLKVNSPLNYDSRLEEFYVEYENYLKDRFEFDELALRTIIMNVVLDNSGSRPAEDIRVLLHFPDGFLLYMDDNDGPKAPDEPSAPSKEMNWFPNNFAIFPRELTASKIMFPDRNSPKIRKTNSYEVDLPCEKLNHHFRRDFDPLYLAFNSWDSAKSFSIEYQIHAANLHSPESGELSVIIERT
jgi:hypothetical protein